MYARPLYACCRVSSSYESYTVCPRVRSTAANSYMDDEDGGTESTLAVYGDWLEI
jgi:hypothetical protein